MAATKRKKKPSSAPDAKKKPMTFGSLQVAWLVAFVESADYKRTAAAATLGVTQSAVTKYIDNLESWYGGGPRRLLMVGNVHPPVLTDEGKEFLPKAREMLALIRAALPPPVVSNPPIKQRSTAGLRVPPAVATMREGDGTFTGTDQDSPAPDGSTRPGTDSL